jgi:hypothetical protein
MAHQYQWMIQGAERMILKKLPLVSHGPSFYKFAKIMAKYGIPLRTEYSTGKWFSAQNILSI